MEKKRVFSGIQPSGDLHIGNYLGAISRWVEGQEDGLNIFCVVDMHAITVPQSPAVLREKTFEVVGLLLASGIDPKKSILFVQSHNPDHANLAWVLNCFTSMGQMSRMTQFKEKSEKKKFVSVGLFDYPALMAADILLYDTTEVPVGGDQKQHVELTRDIAGRFNSRCGKTFVIPKPVIPKVGARIMSLTNPKNKMSKSDKNVSSRIGLLDNPDEIRKKIMSAVTDSASEVKHDAKKPGISNLLEIYSQVTGKTIADIEGEFQGKGYGDFKKKVADVVVVRLAPLQEKYKTLRKGGDLEKILSDGARKAGEISSRKLKEVYKKVGFVL
jgi:tryptophanyl-tRNA synthetase